MAPPEEQPALLLRELILERVERLPQRCSRFALLHSRSPLPRSCLLVIPRLSLHRLRSRCHGRPCSNRSPRRAPRPRFAAPAGHARPALAPRLCGFVAWRARGGRSVRRLGEWRQLGGDVGARRRGGARRRARALARPPSAACLVGAQPPRWCPLGCCPRAAEPHRCVSARARSARVRRGLHRGRLLHRGARRALVPRRWCALARRCGRRADGPRRRALRVAGSARPDRDRAHGAALGALARAGVLSLRFYPSADLSWRAVLPPGALAGALTHSG